MGIPGLSDPLYTLSGFGVGVLVGVTGVGGGSLMTPLLVLLFGIHPTTAVGTDLLYAAVTKSVGTALHGIRRTVEWRIVGWLAAGSVPATLLTILTLRHAAAQGGSYNRALTLVLAAALVVTAVSLLLRQPLLRFAGGRGWALPPAAVVPLTVASGVVLGVIVTFSSVGAGAIGMTALVFLYPRQAAARLVASDIAHAVPLTLLAGIGHWYLGAVDWALLRSLLVGSVPGIVLGTFISTMIPGGVLRPVVAVTLLLVARQLVA
jgi:uncharacterized protein